MFQAESIRLSSPELTERGEGNHSPRLLWDSLQPLCACSAVEDFEVFWHTVIRINNEEMTTLAGSWPRLKRLVIEGAVLTGEDDLAGCCLSFDCLAILGERCSALQELSIAVLPALFGEQPPHAALQRTYFPDMASVFLRLGVPPALNHSSLPLSSHSEAEKIAKVVRLSFPENCHISYHIFQTSHLPQQNIVSNLKVSRFWNAVIAALAEASHRACQIQEITAYYLPRYK